MRELKLYKGEGKIMNTALKFWMTKTNQAMPEKGTSDIKILLEKMKEQEAEKNNIE